MPFNFNLPSRSKLTTPRDPNVPKGTEDPSEDLMSKDYLDWFAKLQTFFQATPSRQAAPLSVTAQSATILSTSIPIESISQGLYRVSAYARVTTAATTSSSLTVSIGFPDGAVSCTLSGAALTGNTTSTVQSNIWQVRVDNAGPITYATTYASVGATAMTYALYITVENVALL